MHSFKDVFFAYLLSCSTMLGLESMSWFFFYNLSSLFYLTENSQLFFEKLILLNLKLKKFRKKIIVSYFQEDRHLIFLFTCSPVTETSSSQQWQLTHKQKQEQCTRVRFCNLTQDENLAAQENLHFSTASCVHTTGRRARIFTSSV